jgi:hypothetical protein
MSLRTKVFAAAAALTLIGGTGAVLTAGSASAGTPSCGTNCPDIYPQEFAPATNTGVPSYVLDTFRQGEKAGQPVILFRSANFDPAEDFTYAFQGLASDFYAAGLLSSALALHYGCSNTGAPAIPCANGNGVDDPAYEIEYAPFGVDSGLCVGVAAAAASGEGLTLQGCGQTSRTTWLQDTFSNDDSPSGQGFWAAINGSGTDYSNPEVMTYPQNAVPTDKPRAQVELENLAQFSQGSPFDDTDQLWNAYAGVLNP